MELHVFPIPSPLPPPSPPDSSGSSQRTRPKHLSHASHSPGALSRALGLCYHYREPILILLIEMHSQQSLWLWSFLVRRCLWSWRNDLVSPDEPESSLSDSAVTHAPQMDGNNSPLHFILPFYHFLKFIFHWIIALQCHVSFCHTSVQVNYMYNTSPPLESPSHPLPVPLGCLGAPGWAPSVV